MQTETRTERRHNTTKHSGPPAKPRTSMRCIDHENAGKETAKFNSQVASYLLWTVPPSILIAIGNSQEYAAPRI